MNTQSEEKKTKSIEKATNAIFFKIANVFLIISNLSLLILGYYNLNSKQDNSYFSVIVAVLCILVTILITWQIWQTVNAEKRLQKIEQDNNQFKIDINNKIQEIKNKTYNISREMLGVRLYCDATSSFSGANIRLLIHSTNINIDEIVRAYRETALSLRISISIQHSGMLVPHCLESLDLSLYLLENTEYVKTEYVFSQQIGNTLDSCYFDIIKIIRENHKHRELLDIIRNRRLAITENYN